MVSKEQRRTYYRAYYLKNKERILATQEVYRKTRREHYRRYHKETRAAARTEALNHYGAVCICCGETRTEFLAFDHIAGGGNKHKKENRIYYMGLWLKENGFPQGFRILCHNCNSSRGYYGYCPHEKEKNE